MSDQAVNTKRSFIAHGALMSAARIVCQQITCVLIELWFDKGRVLKQALSQRLKQMQHCFPNYDHESDFFKALAAETVKLLETSFQAGGFSETPGNSLIADVLDCCSMHGSI